MCFHLQFARMILNDIVPGFILTPVNTVGVVALADFGLTASNRYHSLLFIGISYSRISDQPRHSQFAAGQRCAVIIFFSGSGSNGNGCGRNLIGVILNSKRIVGQQRFIHFNAMLNLVCSSIPACPVCSDQGKCVACKQLIYLRNTAGHHRSISGRHLFSLVCTVRIGNDYSRRRRILAKHTALGVHVNLYLQRLHCQRACHLGDTGKTSCVVKSTFFVRHIIAGCQCIRSCVFRAAWCLCEDGYTRREPVHAAGTRTVKFLSIVYGTGGIRCNRDRGVVNRHRQSAVDGCNVCEYCCCIRSIRFLDLVRTDNVITGAYPELAAGNLRGARISLRQTLRRHFSGCQRRAVIGLRGGFRFDRQCSGIDPDGLIHLRDNEIAFAT